jgi:hypothetical protein
LYADALGLKMMRKKWAYQVTMIFFLGTSPVMAIVLR